MSDKVYVGIDIGKKGGIAIMFQGKIHLMKAMPLIADEDVNVKEIIGMINFYDKGSVHVVMEKFGGFFGMNKSCAVSLARQGAMIESALALLDIPFTKVQPQQWQRVCWEGTNIYTKADGKKDTKKISLITARRLFPSETFLATPRCSKPHDGIIDGLLLAEFGRRKNL